jgi:hypothetical protein
VVVIVGTRRTRLGLERPQLIGSGLQQAADDNACNEYC